MSLRFLLASLKQKPKQAGGIHRPATEREATGPKAAGYRPAGRAVQLAAERSG